MEFAGLFLDGMWMMVMDGRFFFAAARADAISLASPNLYSFIFDGHGCQKIEWKPLCFQCQCGCETI